MGELDLRSRLAVELFRVHLSRQRREPSVIRHQRISFEAVGMLCDDLGVLPRQRTRSDCSQRCGQQVDQRGTGVDERRGPVLSATSELRQFSEKLDPFDPGRGPHRTARRAIRRCLLVQVVSRVGDASGPGRRQSGYLLIKGGDLLERDHIRVGLEKRDR
ncbi:hypothetical protein ASE64_04950 [Agreia sp. Leaf210]|nr:hypothetical protein ASE64_04950 [Agreia sp. Leaf210]